MKTHRAHPSPPEQGQPVAASPDLPVATKIDRTPAARLSGSFAVTLTSSGNTFLKYPAHGRIQPIEIGLDGKFIAAVFQQGEYIRGVFYADGGPVSVRNPKFCYE